MIEYIRAELAHSDCVPSQHEAVVIFKHIELRFSLTWPIISKRRWNERRPARRFAGVWHWSTTGRPIGSERPLVLAALESLT